jgi:hypothetical protein
MRGVRLGHPSSRSYITIDAFKDTQNDTETGKREDLLYEELHVDDRPRGSCRGDGAARETQSALLCPDLKTRHHMFV